MDRSFEEEFLKKCIRLIFTMKSNLGKGIKDPEPSVP